MEQHNLFSTMHFKRRTHTAGSHSDDAQMTCVWHDQHTARDSSTARPALLSTELLLHPVMHCQGCWSQGVGHYPGTWLDPAPCPKPHLLQPQECCLGSVWTLLMVAQHTMGNWVGSLCTCCTVNERKGSLQQKQYWNNPHPKYTLYFCSTTVFTGSVCFYSGAIHVEI